MRSGNEAKRFIALIDTFYDNAVKLVHRRRPRRPIFIAPRKATRRRNSAVSASSPD